MRSWDKPGRYLFTAPAASGVKRARARFRLLHGTGEPVVLESPCPDGRGGGSSSSGRNRERQSTGPGHGGGPSRSSDEAAVMAAEQRGRAIRRKFTSQPETGRNEWVT
jgi:hypothetical protein